MANDSLYNENELLQKVADGNEAAFAALFHRYRDNIYTTVLRLTGHEWLAEEVLQDSFLKVWLKRTELPALDNFGGWLYTLASRLAINALRAASKKNIPLEDHSFIADAEEMLLDKQYQGLLQQAIGKLPQRQQQTFRLIKEQGLKRDEAAAIMNISSETVKYHLEQAVRSVRTYLIARIGDVPVAVVLLLAKKYF